MMTDGFNRIVVEYIRNNLLTPEQQAQFDEALREDPSLLDGLTIENVYRDPSILTDRIQQYLAEHPPPTDQAGPFAPAPEGPTGADSTDLSDPALYNTGVAGPLGTPPPGTIGHEGPDPLDPNVPDPDVSMLPPNLAEVLTPEQMQALDQASLGYGDMAGSSPTETGPGLGPSMFDDAEAAGPTIHPSPESFFDPSQLEASLTEPSGVTDLSGVTDPNLTDPSLTEEPGTADQDVHDQDFEGI